MVNKKKASKTKAKSMAFSRTKDPQKTAINKALARYGRRDKLAIVLDGATAETSKTLIKAGWRKTKIFVPNPTKDYTHLIKKQKKLGINVEKLWLNEFLDSSNPNSIGLAYMDYMCTLHGNDNVSPMDDIQKLFNQKLLADGAIVGITICIRTTHKKKGIFTHEDMIKLLSCVTSASISNGYTTKILDNAGFYRSMWTVLLKVYQNV